MYTLAMVPPKIYSERSGEMGNGQMIIIINILFRCERKEQSHLKFKYLNCGWVYSRGRNDFLIGSYFINIIIILQLLFISYQCKLIITLISIHGILFKRKVNCRTPTGQPLLLLLLLNLTIMVYG